MTLNSIVANFQTFKLVDLLDILIIAFLIYQLLGIVNRTRAGQLAKGALIVLAVYLVANILNMRTVTWLLNSLLQVGLLTLVVLFQPEIRRALERMGQTDQWAYRFFNKSRYNDTSLKGAWRSAIIAICDAAERFSETKTGALIVIEQKVSLRDYERTGIDVDGIVTSQLLINIFEKNTPLHDGAVIVQGNRVTYATCYLPLSDNMRLSKDLGTRHRAGVGISEVTDSMTVIVSEENGKISVAYEGTLSRGLTAEELEEKLRSIQKKPTDEKAHKRWKGWFHNEK